MNNFAAKNFVGKNIWIIGASSGIGAALAIKLSKLGANLAISSRDAEKLNSVYAQLQKGKHAIYPLDVTDAHKLKITLEEVVKNFQKLDSIIFMAAAYKPHDGSIPSLENIKQIVDVNFTAALNVAYSALPIFYRQNYGQIVLCASVAGYRGLPNGQPYCATKAALINFAESLKVENEGKNIDVKVINPGFVKTPLTDKNNFDMPLIITADNAAEEIIKGLKSKAFEIHFPKLFTYAMKLIKILPNFLFFHLARAIKNKSNS